MGCTASLEEQEQLVVRKMGGVLDTIEGPSACAWVGSATVVERRSMVVLDKRQYAMIRNAQTGERRIINGPNQVYLGPHDSTQGAVMKPALKTGEYLRVRNSVTGVVRVVNGPAVVEVDVDDVVGEVLQNRMLGKSEYAIVTDQKSGTKRVINGPCLVTLTPHEDLTKVSNRPVLEVGEYCVVKNVETGHKQIHVGPAIIEMGPHDSVTTKDVLPVLQQAEYCKVRNQESGVMRIVYGPCIVDLGAFDEVASKIKKLPVLQKDEYVKIVNEEHGAIRMHYGPDVVKLGVYDAVIDGIQKCVDLSADQYISVRNEEDGTIRNVVGPQLFQPGAFDSFGAAQKVYNLRKNEYVRLQNGEGELRIVRGELRLIPDPMETVLDDGIMQAVNIDNHHAVLVRNLDVGSLQLITEHGLFFPTPYQEIVEVQKKVILEKYETVVCKDSTGQFYYASGDTDLPASERGPGPDFFLPPHHEIVKHSWSTDLRKEHATSEEVWKFDSRPTYMNYEFCCRTLDNVTLIIDITFFWRIVDVRSMVESTADAPGDTCTHARSMIMQKISQIKLMDFLKSFNDVIRDACLQDSFYGKRGVELLSVEVLKFECESEDTNRTLQEMIMETCDRLKFKERQRGENEVALEKLAGEIEEEKRRQELVEVRKSHVKTEARIEGEAEGLRIAAYLAELAKSAGGGQQGMDAAMKFYMTTKNNEYHVEATRALASGNAQLYLLPQDVSLNLGTLHNPTHGLTAAGAGGVKHNPIRA